VYSGADKPREVEERKMAGKGTIKVLIADDHDMVRWGMKAVLGEAPDIVVVGEASSGFGLYADIVCLMPDVLILDLMMPGLDCLALLKQISQMRSGPAVIVVSARLDTVILLRGLEIGLSGYLLKEDALGKSFVRHVRTVANGDLTFSESARRVLEQKSRQESGLTAAQLEVVVLMANGYEAREIAEKTGRSMTAIYNMESRIREKLGVETGRQVVLKAIALGLVLEHEVASKLVC
jgi:DNA-binding NarL/FixJ family response regulator